jgi:hypothetical protein
MKASDFDAIIRIDEKVLKISDNVFKASRREYYGLKFEELVQSTDHLPTSLVACSRGRRWKGGGVCNGGALYRRIWYF